MAPKIKEDKIIKIITENCSSYYKLISKRQRIWELARGMMGDS